MPAPPETAWSRAARRLLAKMLAEFAYEGIVTPDPDGPPADAYRLPVAPGLTYRVRARRGGYGHWRLDPGSITRPAPTRWNSSPTPTTPSFACPATPRATSSVSSWPR